VFTVNISLGGPTAASDAPPASDNAPATPNTVTAFVRPFRFEFRLLCDMVEASHFTPAPSSISIVRLVAYRFNCSGSFAKFAAIRRASSRVSAWQRKKIKNQWNT
jgi:hypothetical protein